MGKEGIERSLETFQGLKDADYILDLKKKKMDRVRLWGTCSFFGGTQVGSEDTLLA